MELLALAVLIGLIPAVIAKGKGSSFGLWWIYGSMLFIIALPHSLIMRPSAKGIERQRLAEGMKKCDHCAEYIKADAKVCRYCGRECTHEAERCAPERYAPKRRAETRIEPS